MKLPVLMQHIRACPPEFFEVDRVHLGAIVNDLLLEHGGPVPSEGALKKILEPASAERMRMSLFLCWVLWCSDLRSSRNHAPAVARLLEWLPTELGPHVGDVRQILVEQERCEDVARMVLRGLGLVPEGESEGVAQARLEEISTVERVRVARETAEKLAKKREIEEALRKKAAEEAAARAWHE